MVRGRAGPAAGETLALYTISPSSLEKCRSMSRLRTPPGVVVPEVHTPKAGPSNPPSTPTAIPSGIGSPAAAAPSATPTLLPRSPKPFPGALPGHSLPVWNRPSLHTPGGAPQEAHPPPKPANTVTVMSARKSSTATRGPAGGVASPPGSNPPSFSGAAPAGGGANGSPSPGPPQLPGSVHLLHNVLEHPSKRPGPHESPPALSHRSGTVPGATGPRSTRSGRGQAHMPAGGLRPPSPLVLQYVTAASGGPVPPSAPGAGSGASRSRPRSGVSVTIGTLEVTGRSPRASADHAPIHHLDHSTGQSSSGQHELAVVARRESDTGARPQSRGTAAADATDTLPVPARVARRRSRTSSTGGEAPPGQTQSEASAPGAGGALGTGVGGSENGGAYATANGSGSGSGGAGNSGKSGSAEALSAVPGPVLHVAALQHGGYVDATAIAAANAANAAAAGAYVFKHAGTTALAAAAEAGLLVRTSMPKQLAFLSGPAAPGDAIITPTIAGTSSGSGAAAASEPGSAVGPPRPGSVASQTDEAIQQSLTWRLVTRYSRRVVLEKTFRRWMSYTRYKQRLLRIERTVRRHVAENTLSRVLVGWAAEVQRARWRMRLVRRQELRRLRVTFSSWREQCGERASDYRLWLLEQLMANCPTQVFSEEGMRYMDQLRGQRTQRETVQLERMLAEEEAEEAEEAAKAEAEGRGEGEPADDHATAPAGPDLWREVAVTVLDPPGEQEGAVQADADAAATDESAGQGPHGAHVDEALGGPAHGSGHADAPAAAAEDAVPERPRSAGSGTAAADADAEGDASATADGDAAADVEGEDGEDGEAPEVAHTAADVEGGEGHAAGERSAAAAEAPVGEPISDHTEHDAEGGGPRRAAAAPLEARAGHAGRAVSSAAGGDGPQTEALAGAGSAEAADPADATPEAATAEQQEEGEQEQEGAATEQVALAQPPLVASPPLPSSPNLHPRRVHMVDPARESDPFNAALSRAQSPVPFFSSPPQSPLAAKASARSLRASSGSNVQGPPLDI